MKPKRARQRGRPKAREPKIGVGVSLSPAQIDKIDDLVNQRRDRFRNRSEFIREAVAEALRRNS